MLIVILLLILVIEAVLEAAEQASKRHHVEGLIRKLYHEFILLGIIEICLILLTNIDTFNQELESSEW